MTSDQDEPEVESESLQALKRRRKEKMRKDLRGLQDDPRLSPTDHRKAAEIGKGLTKPVRQ